MSKIFLDRDNNVVYEGYETHEVVANPTLAGTEDNLTGLKIGNTKYKVSSEGAAYTAGRGINIDNNEIAVDTNTVPTITQDEDINVFDLGAQQIEAFNMGDIIYCMSGIYEVLIKNNEEVLLQSKYNSVDRFLSHNIRYVYDSEGDVWNCVYADSKVKCCYIADWMRSDEMCFSLLGCIGSPAVIIVEHFDDSTNKATQSFGALEEINDPEDYNYKISSSEMIIYFNYDDSGDYPIVDDYIIEPVTPPAPTPTVDDYMLKVNLTYSSSAGEYITDYTLQEIYNAASSGKMVYIYYVNSSNQYNQYTTFNIIKDAAIRLDPHGEADATYNFNLIYVVDEDDPDDAGIIFDYDNQKFTYFYTPVD